MQTGESPLIAAVKHGRSEMVEWLIGNGATVDQVDGNGRSAFLHAIAHGNTEIAITLITAGADVNFVADLGLTAMHFAAMRQSEILISFLAGQGAHVDMQDRRGWTPLMLAVNVFKAAADSNEYKISDALDHHKAETRRIRDKDKQGGLNAIACLVRNGADFRAAKCNLTGRSVFEKAQRLGLSDVVQLFTEMEVSLG